MSKTHETTKLKVGSVAYYVTCLPGYTIGGRVVAIDKDGFVTFDAGSRGSFNLVASDLTPAVQS